MMGQAPLEGVLDGQFGSSKSWPKRGWWKRGIVTPDGSPCTNNKPLGLRHRRKRRTQTHETGLQPPRRGFLVGKRVYKMRRREKKRRPTEDFINDLLWGSKAAARANEPLP